MSLTEWLDIRRLIKWWKYRKVDHFEIRWREPGGRGWKQVEPRLDDFDPSDLDQPIPLSHFHDHASAMEYYQGEYRLVPIDEDGRMMDSVWQTKFWDGPRLEAERREQQRKREEELEHLREIEQDIKEIEKQRLED
ncbi:MAG: hypothetical protein ABEH59_12800 [Halobacteriales archaeon]